jgi:AcrR family transcriptional regulator
MQHTYNQPVSSTEPPTELPTKAPTARTRRREQTQARILASARHLFAETGYDRTTIRAIAAHAGVNPGLVMHYFGSKEDLFHRAASLSPTTSDTEAPERLTEHLLGSLATKLDGLPAASGATLRSMLTHPDAADDVRDAINQEIQQIGAGIPAEDRTLRATLIGATIMGIVIGRHLLHLDALRDATPTQVTDLLRPCLQSLTHNPPQPHQNHTHDTSTSARQS